MPIVWKQLAYFGEIHKNDKRVIVATLQESTGDGKTNRYFSFYEHYMGKDGKLYPRSKKNINAKYPEEIISFTLPFTKEILVELVEIIDKMSDYTKPAPKPVPLEDDFMR